MSVPPTLYHYDTYGALVSSGPAMLSPGDAALGVEVWLIPANSTDIAPPVAGAGEVAVFAAGAWSLVEDHRGTVVYDTTTRQSEGIEAPGPIPPGKTTLPPPSPEHEFVDGEWVLPLEDAQVAKVAAVAAELKARNLGGFTHLGNVFRLDDGAIALLGLIRAAAPWPGGITVLATNDAPVAFTNPQLVAFTDAAATVALARQVHARNFRVQIAAATTQAELDAIDVMAGWP